MRKLVFAALLAIGTGVSAQTVMTIGDEAVSKAEFEYYYHKNNGNLGEKPLSPEEYAQLFINFKLKVKAAYEAGMDTIRSFQEEFQGYRSQLVGQYLTDNEMKQTLVDEAVGFTKEDVQASHILLRTTDPIDTLRDYNRALELRNRLTPANFADMAEKYSEDPTASMNKGALGYFSGLSMVYPFAHAAYNTPIGTISMPVRTRFGYHLIYVTDRRKAKGDIRLSGIVKGYAPYPGEREKAKALMDSLYQVALSGETSFDSLMYAYTDNPRVRENHGLLPWLSIGMLPPEQEAVLFGLENIGDFTAPMELQGNWFLFKLNDRREAPEHDELMQLIESSIMRDERSAMIQQSFVNGLKKKYSFTTTTNHGDTLAHFADVWLTNADLQAFLISGPYLPADTLQAFFAQQLIQYENDHLEAGNPEFGYLMKEYRDGILLFNISNEKIWNKAPNDEAGLKAYFEKNRKKYKLSEPRYKGCVVYCRSLMHRQAAEKVAKHTEPSVLRRRLLAEFNTDSLSNIEVEEGLFKLGDHPVVDAMVFKTGTAPVKEGYPEMFVSGKLQKKYPEEYTEVRGAVMSDYQDYLEQQWVDELKQRYQVVIDKQVLKTIR
ncbi:MAG: peptidylprolyl isomerase [Paludibacteraceae bacterium]|nr:peptidylprolyl isomerase [Paludibacteraceae bacterium]